MKKSACLFFGIIFFLTGYTQSLNGVWKSTYERSIWVLNPIKSEVELSILSDSLLTGVEHAYYKKGGFTHTKLVGTINWKDSVVVVDEIEEITNLNLRKYESYFGKLHLRLTREGNSLFLRGKWKDKDTRLFHIPTLDAVWQKEMKDDKDTGPEAVNIKRATVVQQVIELNRDEIDSIKIALYDDGVVDGDTATLYFNDSPIVNRVRLTEQPIYIYVSLDKSKKFQKVYLVADNLGSIPPNTALLIITTKRKRYEIRLSSDDHQNGSVEFFLKE